MSPFDEETEEFLGALDPSTRKLYRSGLLAFQKFYGAPIKCFLDGLEQDMQRPRRERKRVGRNTLKEFIEWLRFSGYAPKTAGHTSRPCSQRPGTLTSR